MQPFFFTKTRLSILLMAFFLIEASQIFAQVTVNEYSAANWKQFKDNYDNTEDWIELYNSAATTTNISAWGLTDDDTNLQKWQFPTGTSIPAGGFLRVWCSKRNENVGGVLHTNFSLNQTKGNDIIVLSKANGVIVNSITVEKTQVHQSRCRATDGANTWKICTTPTPSATNNGSTQFSSFATRPEMSLAAGFYPTTQTVSITTTEAGATLHYTLDGTQPTLSSPVYAGPLTLAQTTVVKAIAYSADATKLPSFIQFNTYFINEDFSLVVVSVASDSLLDLANGNRDLKPVGTIEYFGQDKLRKTRSFGELNSHGQDSWVNDQRSLDWVSRDEMGYSNALKEKLFGYSDRTEYQRVILRASGDDNYPGNMLPQHEGCTHIRDEYAQALAKLGGLKLDIRAAERMIVFLNGEYWGVYGLREYPDDSDYTDEYHKQDKYHIQMLETWGDTWAQYGGDQAFTDWRKLQNFILNNDMSVQANYDSVKNELNVTSLCDYFITGLNYVASDWINYNTAWWRGTDPNGNHKKWGYMLWDYDAVFNYYINYSGVPNTEADATPCDIDAISDYIQNDFFGGFGSANDTCFVYEEPGFPADTFCVKGPGQHDLIFRKLQEENAEFRQLYYARKTDLENTVFTCDNMLHVLDSMVAVIDPEMTRHAARWGGSYSDWKANVLKLRNYIALRCTLFDEGMVNCFEVTGPYNVTLMVEPVGAGTIDFNTLKLTSFPWSGNYYGGMENLIQAKATGNLAFLRWESRSGSAITPNVNAIDAAITLTQPDTLVAIFGTPSATFEPAKGFALTVNPTLVNQEVNINYTLPESMPVALALYSITGQKVMDIETKTATEGQNSVQIDLSKQGISSGMYFLSFQAGTARSLVKLTYLDRK
jgi:hypothetical protein